MKNGDRGPETGDRSPDTGYRRPGPWQSVFVRVLSVFFLEKRMSLLAIHPGALGDVILLGHLLRAMEGRKTLIAGSEKAKLLVGMGVVDAAKNYDSLPAYELYGEVPRSQARLSRAVGRHEWLISFVGVDDERVQDRLCDACGARVSTFLPVRPPPEWEGHLVEYWESRLRALSKLGLGWSPWDRPLMGPFGLDHYEGKRSRAPWAVPGEWRDAGRRRYAVIHPGAGSPAKCWPLERFAALAETLGERGLAAVFVVGPVERERWSQDAMKRIPPKAGLLDCPTLAKLAGVLAGAELYVGNDSGTSHLAAAVGTRTLALFGPTRAEHFRPLGPRVRVIQAATMEQVALDRVRQEALAMLNFDSIGGVPT